MSFYSILPLATGGLGDGAGVLHTFLTAGPMALAVAGVLVFLSVVSWALMIGKFFHVKRASSQTGKFLNVFRNSKRFSEVNASTASLKMSPLVGLFQAGYLEVDTQIKAAQVSSDDVNFQLKSLASVDRSLRRAMSVELLVLSKGTGFLATTAAASPFIGLFGTVWGIMNAFNDIAQSGSTSLVAVAPGIAEALVNTALGLVAAIPALMGYNYFSQHLGRLRAEMQDFILEFLNLSERNFT